MTDVELDELQEAIRGLRLTAQEWQSIDRRIVAVATGADGAVDELRQAVFEARIAQRFRGGRAASTLPPTKKVSILPWVGLVCGSMLMAVGWSLGGGVMLVGVALLSLGVFAVAFAGSRVAHRPSTDGADEPTEQLTAPPDVVVDRLDRLVRDF